MPGPPPSATVFRRLFAWFGAALSLGGCGDTPSTQPAAPPEAAPFQFLERGVEAGLDFVHRSADPDRKPNMFEAIGSGVAVADFNGDEHLDIYLVNGGDLRRKDGPTYRNRLYFGDGKGGFRPGAADDPSADPGYGFCATAADYDRDGDVDLFVGNWGRDALLRNRGDGTFENVTSAAGLDDDRWSAAAAFGDLDGDGLLDLYVANYYVYRGPDGATPGPKDCTWAGIPVGCGPRGYPAEQDRVWRNRGDGTFEDVTETWGVAAEAAKYGLSVDIFDADGDGDQDVYVANDTHDNAFWENDGKGGLTDVALMNGTARSVEGVAQAGMAVVPADLDGDGRLDLVVTAFSRDYNTCYFRRPSGDYEDRTVACGVARATWSYLAFGANAEDFDADGDLDLFFANGHVFPEVDAHPLDTSYRQTNQLLRNRGGGLFDDVSASSGPAFALKALGRGSAVGDFDEDGRLDLVVNNLDGRPFLLMNRTPPQGRSLRVRLRADAGVSDRTCVGAVVTVKAGGRTWIKAATSGGSFASSSLADLFFGLGAVARIDEVRVRYADGKIETRAEPPLDGLAEFRRGKP